MKLDILQENLSKALSTATRIVSTKPQLPILSHVLITAASNRLTLTTSSLESTIIIPVGAKIESEGEFTVPARTFQELISSLSPGKISLAVKDTTLQISSGKFTGQINGTPASEFPKISVDPKTDSLATWEITADQLMSTLSKTIFSSATDESRAVLTGVLFRYTEAKIVAASTDGFRLSVVELDKKGKLEGETDPIIIPSRTLLEIVKLLSEENSEIVKINFLKNNQTLFLIGETQIYTQLIAGNFPNFEKIIPSEAGIRIKVPAEELMKSIRLASIFARDSANIVKLKVAGKTLKVSANAAQVGENESEIDIEVDKGSDEEFQIAFNYRYLLDYLTSLGTKAGEITIEFTTPLAPGVFRTPSDKNYLHLIMPVRVQS